MEKKKTEERAGTKMTVISIMTTVVFMGIAAGIFAILRKFGINLGADELLGGWIESILFGVFAGTGFFVGQIISRKISEKKKNNSNMDSAIK